MRITLGYPSAASERLLLKGEDPRANLKKIQPLITIPQLLELQRQVNAVKASDAVIDYLQRLVERTRRDSHFSYGLSPRGAMAWLRAAKAWALIHGREYLIPEDLQ